MLNLLQRQLKSAGYEVLTASDGLSALNLARRHRPDLIVLDITMPGMSGLDVCRRIRDDHVLQDVLILFLTSRNEVEDRVQGLDTGADDYLPKPFDTNELLARVRALFRRSERQKATGETGDHALHVGPVQLEPARCVARVRDDEYELTRVQFDLLYHLMSHPNEVFAADQLLVQVWGYAPGTGDTSLVRWHIKNLRNILEEDPSSPQFLCTVPRQGYVVRAPQH